MAGPLGTGNLAALGLRTKNRGFWHRCARRPRAPSCGLSPSLVGALPWPVHPLGHWEILFDHINQVPTWGQGPGGQFISNTNSDMVPCPQRA